MKQWLGPVIPALLILTGITPFGCLGMSRELRQNGVSAPATILEIWDTGWTVNDDPVIGMRVRVQPSDRPAFEATIPKVLISRIAVPQYQPGKVVPVRYLPQDPRRVAVDPDPPVASAPVAAAPPQ